MIKGVLIDYGGTIDTNGRHWANVIWEAYIAAEVTVDKDEFMRAYAFGEKALAIHPIIQVQHTFYEVLCLKFRQQFDFLRIPATLDYKIEEIAGICMELVKRCTSLAKPTLAALSATYPMVLVSNFYGNIHAVLADLGLLDYFVTIVESAVVGVRKPDPAIYRLGVEQIGLKAAACVVIGDSFKKDIVPGKAVGCKTIWMNVEGLAEDLIEAEADTADIQITDFAQIPTSILALSS